MTSCTHPLCCPRRDSSLRPPSPRCRHSRPWVTLDSSVIRSTVPDHSACARVTLISLHNGPKAIHMLSLQGMLITSLFYSWLLLISYCAWFINQTPSQVCTYRKTHSIDRVWCFSIYLCFQASIRWGSWTVSPVDRGTTVFGLCPIPGPGLLKPLGSPREEGHLLVFLTRPSHHT